MGPDNPVFRDRTARVGRMDELRVATDDAGESVGLGTDRPHNARVYDYLLGGKDNYAADRRAAEAALQAAPSIQISMRANRRFMVRATRYAASELGIRQFLDIGTGIPTSPNLHEVAQQVAPDSRIVYVDNDPIVLVHARALMSSTPQGSTAFVEADLAEPTKILESPAVAGGLDLTRPVALSLITVLQFLQDDEQTHSVVRTLTDVLAPGSALVLGVLTSDGSPQEGRQGQAAYRDSGIPTRHLTHDEVVALVPNGFVLQDPGVVLVHRWRPEADDRHVRDDQVFVYGAVAVKAR
jgi:hypothetical protein